MRCALLFTLLVFSSVFHASRDEDDDHQAVEVSGGHFVKQKPTVLSKIQKHQDKGEPDSSVTPEMRQKLAAFGKIAQQALANGKNDNMSAEEKANSVREALAQAAIAMSSMGSLADVQKRPELAEKLEHLKQLTAPSLLQKQQAEQQASLLQKQQAESRASPAVGSRMLTQEMRAQVAAFGKAAVQALANSKKPGMSAEDKVNGMNAVLAKAAQAVTSIAGLVDTKKSPELAQGLAGLKELTTPSLLQKHEEDKIVKKATPSESSASRVTPEMREELAAFSKAAVQALANGNNASMSNEEKAKHVQMALAKASKAMTSMSILADMKKNPELEKKLASFRELTQF